LSRCNVGSLLSKQPTERTAKKYVAVFLTPLLGVSHGRPSESKYRHD
jgi:hypothetical protein